MDRALAKVELHCHFKGTVTPDLLKRLAHRNGLQIPANLIDTKGGYQWENFLEFLNAYDATSSVVKTQLDYRDVAYEYLISAAAEGAIYVELFTSPGHAAAVGLSYRDSLDGIAQGIDDAERETGIMGRMIPTCVRHLGPIHALDVATTVVNDPHPYVVGFGMGGDEAQYSPADFKPAFDLVDAAGLACTCHAGEVLGADSVADTLDVLPVTRIGHGVRAIESAELIERIVDSAITLEVCPGSNLALGLYPDPDAHPLNALRDAGCKITLGSDDPPFFRTSIGHEYSRAKSDFGWTDEDLLQITRTAIDAAFVDEEAKNKLRARL